ncbi:MAG TPA: Fe-S protein assembly co-chaperone HscB [Bacteroidetes bacterium]|nr:Fe-S protein assembly co-chaperone HscB [Bacteroidota bacterium]
MNHFDFYGIPVSFYLDQADLKRRFLQMSKKYHPDFFTMKPEEEQVKALEMSSINNKAYKTLSDFDLRMAYILKEKGILGEEGKNEIPQSFLMEVMDINEAIMELEFGFEEAAFKNATEKVNALENELLNGVKDLLENYEDGKTPEGELKKIKEFYLKKKYLWRIRENLNRFAPASPKG